MNKQISTLTTINQKNLDKISELQSEVLVDGVQNALLEGMHEVEYDFGYGVLRISVSEEGAKFRFVPSAKLEEGIRSVAKGEKGPLELRFETALKERVENTYKDLF